MSTRNQRWLLALLLLLGTAVRLYRFPAVPVGMHRDELSEAYEAWCLLHTGADRWGVHLPAYFISWGSGQNVLQSYLTIPVVAITGLTTLGARLVPIVCGILTLPLMFFTVRRWHGPVAAFTALIILAFSPWQVMLSRWGIENTEQPLFLLLGIYTFGKALDSRSPWVILPSLLPFGLAMYTYGVVVPLMPLMLLLLASVGYKQIVANRPAWTGAAAIFTLFTLPLWFFVFKNYVTKRDYAFERFLPISIPLVPITRLSQAKADLAGQSQFAVNRHFLHHGLADENPWFQVPHIPPLPAIVLFLAAIGLALLLLRLVQQRRFSEPFLPILLTCCVLFLLFPLNISRATPIYTEIIAIAAVGFTALFNASKAIAWKSALTTVCAVVFLLSTARFLHTYFGPVYAAEIAPDFAPDLPKALTDVTQQSEPGTPIYISDKILLNYVDLLFYLKVDPKTFQTSGATWEHPDFGPYRFSRTTAADMPHPLAFLLSPGEAPLCNNPVSLIHDGPYLVGKCQ